MLPVIFSYHILYYEIDGRDRSCAGLCRFVPVVAGRDRSVPVPTEIAERTQETLYFLYVITANPFLRGQKRRWDFFYFLVAILI